MKALFRVVAVLAGLSAIAIAAMTFSGRLQVSTPKPPGLAGATARLLAICEQRTIGRKRESGEHLSPASERAIRECVDEMALTYVEGATSAPAKPPPGDPGASR